MCMSPFASEMFGRDCYIQRLDSILSISGNIQPSSPAQGFQKLEIVQQPQCRALSIARIADNPLRVGNCDDGKAIGAGMLMNYLIKRAGSTCPIAGNENCPGRLALLPYSLIGRIRC
jgi:hypothetical protein